MIRRTAALCLCLLGFATPTAFAQAPSQAGYGETHVLPDTSNSTPPSASGNAGSTAPDVAANTGSGAPNAARNTGAPSPNAAATVPLATRGDRLPFTGMDIAAIVLAGLVLLAAGVGLRKATASRSAS